MSHFFPSKKKKQKSKEWMREGLVCYSVYIFAQIIAVLGFKQQITKKCNADRS